VSNFYSGADLKRGVLQRIGELTDGTSSYEELAMRRINELYFNVIAGGNEFDVDLGEPWIWARAPQPLIITLVPPYQTGTVSVTNNSAAGSFSVAPTVSLKNQYLQILDTGNPEKYKIISHTANATAFTLDGPYNGSTGASSSFQVLMINYQIGNDTDILRLVEPFRVYKMTWDEDRNYQVYGLDPNSFDYNYPLGSIVQGMPNRFKIWKDEDKNIWAQMNEFLTEQSRMEVDYIPIPDELTDSDESIPLIPREFRTILEYGPTAMLMLEKGDGRAPSYIQLTQAKMKAMLKATRKEQSHLNSKSKGRLVPRPEFIRVRQRIQAFVKQTQ